MLPKHSLLVCCLDLSLAEGVGSGVLEGGVVSVPGGGGSRGEEGHVAEVFLPQQLLGGHHQVPADWREFSWSRHRLQEHREGRI